MAHFLGDLAVVPNKGSVICVDCHAVQHDAPQCTKCGGALDEFALWTWKDDAKTSDSSLAEKPQDQGQNLAPVSK